MPRCIEWAFSEPLCQDCNFVPTRGGLLPLEHRGSQRIKPGRVWVSGHRPRPSTGASRWPSAWAGKRCCRTRSQHPAESFARLHNPPCMALPCCPPLCTRGAFSLPRCIEWAFSEPLCQDCTLAASGGAGAPRVTAHTAGEGMGVRPPGRCRAGQSNQGRLCPLGQDCTLAPTGVGSPAPEHRSKQRIQPSASFGSRVTLAQCLGR